MQAEDVHEQSGVDPSLRSAADFGESRTAAPDTQQRGNDTVITTWNCRRMGAWADVCTYENVCYDGGAVYFLGWPGGCERDFASCEPIYEEVDLKEGLVYPMRRERISEAGSVTPSFPLNGGALIGKPVLPSVLHSGVVNITWVNKTMWRLPLHFDLDNIWYIASRTMALYRVSRRDHCVVELIVLAMSASVCAIVIMMLMTSYCGYTGAVDE